MPASMLRRGAEAWGAKQHRADQHAAIGQQNASRACRGRGGARAGPPQPPSVVRAQIDCMQQAERQEGQRAAVPDAGQTDGDDGRQRHHFGESAQRPAVRNAGRQPVCDAPARHRQGERVVEIQHQPAGQRHVPALPVVDDALGLVRRVEVQREAQVEHARQPDRHVGVAGKVEVELQRIGQRDAPGREQRQQVRMREARRHGSGNRIGQQRLLQQPDQEDGAADCDVVRADAPGRGGRTNCGSRSR